METLESIINDWNNNVIDFNLFKRKISFHLNEKASVLKLIEKNYISISDVSEYLKNDRDIVMKAVCQNGENLLFGHKKFLDDKELVLKAIKKTGNRCYNVFEHISTALKNDDDIVHLALKQAPECLMDLTEKYSNNKELLLKLKVRYLKWCSDRLRNDRDIVLMTIKIAGKNLKYASREMQDDDEIVMAAVKNDGKSLEFASLRLRGMKKIIRTAIKKDISAVYYISDEAKNNKNIILDILEKDGKYFNLASDNLKKDCQVIRTALLNTIDGLVLPFLSPEILEYVGYGNPIDYFKCKNIK